MLTTCGRNADLRYPHVVGKLPGFKPGMPNTRVEQEDAHARYKRDYRGKGLPGMSAGMGGGELG